MDTCQWRQSFKSFNGPAAFRITCSLCEQSVRSWNSYDYRELEVIRRQKGRLRRFC